MYTYQRRIVQRVTSLPLELTNVCLLIINLQVEFYEIVIKLIHLKDIIFDESLFYTNETHEVIDNNLLNKSED